MWKWKKMCLWREGARRCTQWHGDSITTVKMMGMTTRADELYDDKREDWTFTIFNGVNGVSLCRSID